MMKLCPIARSLTIVVASLQVCGALSCEPAAAGSEGVRLPLTQKGKPVCNVITIDGKGPELLLRRAAEAIGQTVQHWSGAALNLAALDEDTGKLPEGPAIVLATLERLRKVSPEVENENAAVMRTAFMDDQGFACVPVVKQGVARIYVVSRTPRGVYNGAVYLRDFCIDGTEQDLYLQTTTTTRSPQLRGRAIYALTIWGNEQLYTAADWGKIFDSFARDGIDHVYFWVSGHFPSKKFPQSYRVADDQFDSTKESRIATLEDQRRIIRYGQNLGMKVYLGGALGGWVGTRFLTNGQPGTMKKTPKGAYEGKYSLCPSHPVSRRALIEYYEEMFDALPEADGLYIESADEWGGCDCEMCRKPVDAYGSRQFGQAQLSLLQQIAHTVWQRHPHARFAYTIGYSEHKSDPAYYRVVREMSDPRFEWMEARDSWEFPGPGGKTLPACYFSSRILRWRQYYNQSLEDLIHDTNRAAKGGFYGLINAFEPGAGSGSFYKNIPFPTGLLPYVLTGFVFREITWEPILTLEDMHKLVQTRFFGKEASDQQGNDFWRLQDLIRVFAAGKPTAENLQSLAEIEQRINQARATASPKTHESLDLMTRAINDIRKFSGVKS
jgi:hypothetical protein